MSRLSKSKSEAIEKGEEFYFTGKKCKHGHIDKRRTKGSACSECSKVRSREYMRTKRKDPESRKRCVEATRKWRQVKRKDKEWNAENSRKTIEWQKKNKERTNAKNSRWREENREFTNHLIREWKLKNPDKLLVYGQNRRARILEVGGSFTEEDIKQIHKDQKYKCATCGTSTRKKKHIDHKMPLALGGSNWPSNLQILCPTCNTRKGALHPDEFAKRIAANDNCKPKKKVAA